jgi:S1-C subfamily serine protease
VVEILESMSKALADTVETASAGVVRVEARRRLPATGIVWSADGLIVTTHHVVERDDNITIGFANGETASATLVGRDPSTDLAVLRVQKNDLSALPQAAFESLRVGHLVLALGRPGASVLSSLGIVSALEPTERPRGGSQLDHYLQTSVAMYPGFSGGPLLDMSGKVLGINTSAMRGVNLTIPIPTIARVAEALVHHGKVRQGYLGIGAQPVRLPESQRGQIGQETGLLIASIEPNSPADKSGLLIGDILVTFDGVALHQLDDLLGLLTSNRVGTAVPVRLVRAGQVQEINVTVGERE